jgi:3-hydroxyacyl-CoA dehydrogenase
MRNSPAMRLPMAERPVAQIGAGSIGVAWAIVFARAGMSVRLHDPDEGRRDRALAEIAARLADLAEAGLAEDAPEAIAARVVMCATLPEAVAGATHVQENAPEDLALKRALFADMQRHAPPDAVLASSSSAITASTIAGDLAGRERCLVVHPGNPPYLIRVVEVVPAPFTDAAVVRRTRTLLQRVGMLPVTVANEPVGFVFNRLQGALLREAYCLVRDGVIGVEELDTVVREGLGLRWSVVGPFETADLNWRGGVAAHARRMGPAYAAMGAERGQHDPWTEDLVSRVAAERRAALPLEQWEQRVRWRDRALMRAVAARRSSV